MELNENNVNGGQPEGIESVDDVRRHFGGLKANILSSLFDLKTEVKDVDISMDASVRERLGRSTEDAVRQATVEQVVLERIRTARQRFIDLELEEIATIHALAEHADEVLTPDSASPEAILQAATMTEDQALAASDMARAMGDAGADACLVLLRAGMERDMDALVAHIVSFSEEWQNAYNVLAEASQLPESVDESEIGEFFDSQVPTSATQLLGSAQSEANISGMLRG